MLFILFCWALISFIFFIIGFGVVRIINLAAKKSFVSSDFGIEEYFFSGFLVLSMVAGILSLLIPINNVLLIIIGIAVLIIWLLNYKDVAIIFKSFIGESRDYAKWPLYIFIFISLFILTALVHEIEISDTALYHTQCIKWIRSYPVVPGLGNIHGRFAFNSMFFVISALFTFQINDSVIYPLNGLCFIFLVVKLVKLIYRGIKSKNSFEIALSTVVILVCFNILIRWLNSPSPDTICTTLIIYTFLYFLDISRNENLSKAHIILLNLLVFTCAVYKLSAVFMVLLIIPFWKKSILKGMLLSSLIGIVVVLPFFIRNYFLSGYLVYPFPAIDIFNVDWKIPMERVIDEKAWIVSWARMPGKPYGEVLGLPFTQWCGPWLDSINDFIMVIMGVNLASFILMIFMIARKEYNYLIIMLVLIANYTFWFLNAPDPRFIYGILIFNFSFAIAYIVLMININSFSGFLKYSKIVFAVILIFIAFRFKSYPIHTIRHPNLWLLSTAMEKPETDTKSAGFTYRVSLADRKCYNSEIPCTPFPLSNVVLRGSDISEGFKVVNEPK